MGLNATGAMNRPSQQTAQVGRIPVPVQGVNTLPALSALGAEECHYAYNILPSERGMRTRLGTVEHTNGIVTTAGGGRTVIPFHGAAADRSDDKLFITGSDGIYECTSSGTGNATKVYSFSTTGATAGYGPFIIWTSDAGAQFIQYADSANGLLEYEAATDTWAAVTGITGITETDIRFVTVHKLRIWYGLADDPNPYYLGVRSKTGAATAFNLGSQYRVGGDFAGAFTLTHDSAEGPDDYFVAVSRGGDVLMYQGDDPSSDATWELTGRWRVGSIPNGRKFAAEYGGDVLILSAFGLNSVKELMSGLEAIDVANSVVGKLSNVIRARMKAEITTNNWEMQLHPAEGYLVIQTPERSGSMDQWLHYCLSLTQKGWGFWRGVRSEAMGEWREVMYYTESDGTVWKMQGGIDDVYITDTTGVGVEFSMLTAYSDAGYPGLQKMGAFVRPFFTDESALTYETQVLYDFDLSELTGVGEAGDATGYVWDTATWDNALWGGDRNLDNVFGTAGIGVVLAVAIKGRTQGRATLNELTATWQTGAYL